MGSSYAEIARELRKRTTNKDDIIEEINGHAISSAADLRNIIGLIPINRANSNHFQ